MALQQAADASQKIYRLVSSKSSARTASKTTLAAMLTVTVRIVKSLVSTPINQHQLQHEKITLNVLLAKFRIKCEKKLFYWSVVVNHFALLLLFFYLKTQRVTYYRAYR